MIHKDGSCSNQTWFLVYCAWIWRWTFESLFEPFFCCWQTFSHNNNIARNVEATKDYTAVDDKELSFKAGVSSFPTPSLNSKHKKSMNLLIIHHQNQFEPLLIRIYSQDIIKFMDIDESGWALGQIDGRTGWFPLELVKPLDPTAITSGGTFNWHPKSVHLLSLFSSLCLTLETPCHLSLLSLSLSFSAIARFHGSTKHLIV